MSYSRLLRIRNWPGPLVLIGLGALILRLIYLVELRGTPVLAVIIGDARQYDSWAGQIAGGQWLGTEVPVGIRNYHVGGEFMISTSQLGPNLYIGNHPGAEGAYEPLVPGHGSAAYERDDVTHLAENAMGRKLSPGEVSDYWVRRSLEYIRKQPWDWLRLMGRKFLLTFSATEAADTESIEVYSDYSHILRVLSWINFGVILPLGVFGAWLTRQHWRRLAVLSAILLAMALAVTTFYVMARYRYPMVPIVILFAAAALSAVPGLRGQNWRRWAPGVLLALIVAVPSNFLLRNSHDETLLNVGQELIRMGRPAEAVPLLQKAVSASPDYAPVHFNLGVAFNQAGQKEQALDEFAAAIKLQPDYFDAQAAMALTLLETGRPIGAVQHFREAVRLRPNLVGAHNNLGNALMQAGSRAEAIKEYQEALRLEPNNAAAHNSLAVALQQEGKLEEAIQHYEAALLLQPDHAGAHSNLALALDAKGDHNAAIQHFNRALQLEPANAGIQANLGDLLSRLGRLSEAIAHYEQAATLAGDSLEMHFQLAQAYARAGRLSEAISSFEKALAIAQAAGRNDEALQIEEAITACRSGMTKGTTAPARSSKK